VVPATVEAMRGLGASGIRAVVGPCIHAGCYEFGAADLDRLASVLGDAVRGTTADGAAALDLVAAATASLRRSGIEAVEVVDVCTACSGRHWSFRADGAPERQAVIAWM
jgi:copper oxidase (laccase) domain-containing protein